MPRLRDQIVDNAFVRGLLLLGCGASTIRIAPPLSVSKPEIDEAMEIFEESIHLSEVGIDPPSIEVQSVAA